MGCCVLMHSLAGVTIEKEPAGHTASSAASSVGMDVDETSEGTWVYTLGTFFFRGALCVLLRRREDTSLH